MHKTLIFSMLFLAFSIQSTFSQTPEVLSSSVPYDSNLGMAGNQQGYTNVGDIQTAYNNARRAEEMQFPCIATNSIANMTMPSQATWDNMSSDEKFLFLINSERSARAGVDYCNGEGPVKGVSFIGVDSSIDAIAQAHADDLIANQSTSAASQATNIDQDPNIGGSGCNGFPGTQPDCCHTGLPFSVLNAAYTSGANPTNPNTLTTIAIEVQTVYQWIYGFGATNFTRSMILLQDTLPSNPSNPRGFIDDYGAVGEEGFIGLGIASGVPANPGPGNMHIDMVIISYFDPVPQSIGCNYDCTTCEICPTSLVENATPIQQGHYQASNWIRSAGTVQNPSDVSMSANSFVEMMPSFEVKKNASFHAYIDACYFTNN